MSPIKEIETKLELDSLIEQESSKLTIVKFYHASCGACIDVQPKYIREAQNLSGSADFYQLEVDDVDGAAEKFDVGYLPTFIAFNHGKELGRYIGIKEDGLKRFFSKVKNAEIVVEPNIISVEPDIANTIEPEVKNAEKKE